MSTNNSLIPTNYDKNLCSLMRGKYEWKVKFGTQKSVPCSL